MKIWVGQEGEWDYWEPVKLFRTEAAAKRWEARDRPHRQLFVLVLPSRKRD